MGFRRERERERWKKNYPSVQKKGREKRQGRKRSQEETLKILHNGTSRITRDNILVFFTQNADVFNTIQLKHCFFLLLVLRLVFVGGCGGQFGRGRKEVETKETSLSRSHFFSTVLFFPGGMVSLLRSSSSAAAAARPAAAAPAVARPAAAAAALPPCAPSTSGRREAAAAASVAAAADRRRPRRRPRFVSAHAVSTADDDDAPPLSPDELRGAVAGAQLLERSIGESSVDYLAVSLILSFFFFLPSLILLSLSLSFFPLDC